IQSCCRLIAFKRSDHLALVAAGSGNRFVMLREGYLEFLTPTADTRIAQQLRTAIQRYTGLHLIAFGSADAEADHARLDKNGFTPLPTVALQRQIGTEQGEETARFSVVRVPPGTMAEGRIQYCQQHTPQWLWQERWTAHANGARGLAAVIICVADPQEAAQRYARFTGLLAQLGNGQWRINTQRGALLFVTPEQLQSALGLRAPALPWIAGYVLTSDDLALTRNRLKAGGCNTRELDATHLLLEWPNALGGLVIFQSAGAALHPLT
ncbi:MAG: VOC family protein, partial [Burkholderiales bacterium]